MSRYSTVPTELNLPAAEEAILERWKADATFEKSISQRANAPLYTFDDGPPFATGLPHYGHILTSYVKDVVPRYFTMRGYQVPRRWGWDCHGLPIEYEVEKELGLSGSSEIAAVGLERFTEACRALVLRYANEWERIVTRLGRWVDFENAYKTMDRSYMDSVLWSFRRLHELGLVLRRAQDRALLLPLPDAAVEFRGQARRCVPAPHRFVLHGEVPPPRRPGGVFSGVDDDAMDPACQRGARGEP